MQIRLPVGVSERADKIRFIQGLFLFITIMCGAMLGSPAARGLLSMGMILWRFCHPWQRTAVLIFVCAVGPYAELWVVYGVLLQNGSASDQYSLEWFDASAFFVIMMGAIPFWGASTGMSFRAYALLMAIDAPAAWLFA